MTFRRVGGSASAVDFLFDLYAVYIYANGVIDLNLVRVRLCTRAEVPRKSQYAAIIEIV